MAKERVHLILLQNVKLESTFDGTLLTQKTKTSGRLLPKLADSVFVLNYGLKFPVQKGVAPTEIRNHSHN